MRTLELFSSKGSQHTQNSGTQEKRTALAATARKISSAKMPLPVRRYLQYSPESRRRAGGASNAAGFLSRFAPNDGKGWLHFDLAGSFRSEDTDLFAGCATGLGVRTIARTLLEELK